MAIGALLIALVLWSQDLAGFVTSEGRLDPSLRGVTEPVNVIVALDFTPENFHNERLRSYGVFAGRDKTVNRVRLRMVTPENLRRLSHIAWVSRIEPAR
jgi:hypothetical protein